MNLSLAGGPSRPVIDLSWDIPGRAEKVAVREE